MPTLKVEGMTCAHCERAVTKAVHSVDENAKVSVDRAAGTVTTDSEVRQELLLAAIRAEGYQAQPLAAHG